MASPNSLKRTCEVAQLDTPSLQERPDEVSRTREVAIQPGYILSSQPDVTTTIPTPERSRTSSAAPSTGGSPARDGSIPPVACAASDSSSQPKRRKLTFAEKEVQPLEKQFKEQQRAEERARKDEEKRIKDEERRVKEEALKEEKRRRDEEKEEKKKAREAEKQARDEERKKREAEKKAKEDEKAKKEKSQLRLNSFFTIPSLPLDGSGESPLRERVTISRRGSMASLDGLTSVASSRSASISPEEILKSEYERKFPPFFIQSHTKLAPFNQFPRDEEGLNQSWKHIDESLRGESSGLLVQSTGEVGRTRVSEILYLSSRRLRRRYGRLTSVKDIVARIHGTMGNPIDLAGSKNSSSSQEPLDLLKSTSLKYLRYAEDVRPPYVGTYTKVPQGQSVSKLCRKPFTRALPATNYDYDSEAEWEEPGEGEDLDSEGEEEVGEEEEVDDMEGFLDDDDAGDGTKGTKRRHMMGDVLPVSTGLCWESSSGSQKLSTVQYGQTLLDLTPFRMDVLLGIYPYPGYPNKWLADTRAVHPQSSIDPYSASYWPSPSTAHISTQTSNKSTSATMAPPQRIPLHTVNTSNNQILLPQHSTDTSSKPSPITGSSTSKARKAATKPLPPELLDDFKQAVQGSDLTKAGLVEVLKKQFPKAAKDTIKDTINEIAERVGAKEADKRWRLK
ncbi:MAG: hypothetical protein Q9187_006594 [Circinaria calcarea]